MTEDTLLYLIIGVAVTITLAVLTKATGKKVVPDDHGLFTLKMNPLYGIIGILGLSIGLFLLLIIIMFADQNDNGFIAGVILTLLIFGGTGIPCLMYFRNHKISFNRKTIKATNVFGRTNQIEWADILEIKFNAFSGLLKLTANNETIKVHQHLVGLTKFIEFMEMETKWTHKELKIPIRK
jgi:hypothetical protein